jgi:CheY-like chemotaxis protein
VTVHVSPIRNAAGTVTGLMAAIRDITERKRAEEALRAAARAKDEFLAMLGHELRNPLGAIAGAAGVLDRKGAPNAHAQQARAVIGRQVQHLSRLVDDLLDVTRVSSGKVALSLRRLDLAELVTGVLGAWRTSGRLDHHEVSLEVTPAWIDADEARMEQIVANLMGNALKYTPPGGRVVVRVRPEGEVAVLEVADTGVGIPADLIGRVFDAFVQGERALDRSQGGLGLGLSLVKALVDRHDGSVQASSPGPNQGAVFTVRLPRRDPAQPRAVPSTAGAGTTPHRRVLVIEDNEDSREMLSVALQLAGHEVHSAPDGPGGLALIAAVSPDVALIDVGLPGMDGYEVARRIRADRGDDGILLIAITGYGQAEDRRRARAAGFDAHLTKPVAPERLLEAIAAAAAGPAR